MSGITVLTGPGFVIDIVHNPRGKTSFATVWPPDMPPREVFRPGRGRSIGRLYIGDGQWTFLRTKIGAEAVLARAHAKLTAELPDGLTE